MRIAINGYGRIGKSFFRVLLDTPELAHKLEVVAINVGYGDPERIVHNTKYDSTMPTYTGELSYKNGVFSAGPYRNITVLQCVDFDKLDWQFLDVDWVVDCTGQCTQRENAEKHLSAGAKKVLISAPAENEDVSIIPGVNDSDYEPETHHIISTGSCTTNALLPLLKVFRDNFTIEKAFMTTTHAYTNSQALLDETSGFEKVRRARSAPNNVVPTTTGASEMVDKIYPDICDCIKARAIRTPVPIVSLVDLVVTTSQQLSVDRVHECFYTAADNELKNILAMSDEPCVSTDYTGSDASVTLDTPLTQVIGDSIKVFGWYDNEWGYSARMRDFLLSCCS